MEKDENRLSTKDIIKQRNIAYSKMLEKDRKEQSVAELRGFVKALDWVLGG
jgi:hypothetical protein